jgi:starch phosphorylase
MLSTFLPENNKWDRDLTKYLYSSDGYTRLVQEAILGIGGYRALKKLGYAAIDYYHMNEGHTALLTIERLRQNGFNEDTVRQKCTFTTHTPIPAGHDYFDYNLATKTLGSFLPDNIRDYATHDRLGMTQLAMNLSSKTNSVSKRHNEVCQSMFPGYEIENVTNGVYHPRWIGSHMKALYDEHFPNWEYEPEKLIDAPRILPSDELTSAHAAEKKEFVDWINENKDFLPLPEVIDDDMFKEDVLTIGFARRFVPYKRPDLIFKHLDKLREIGYRKLQIVFAGKCHPDDMYCNTLKDAIAKYASEFRGQIRIAIIPTYNLDVAKHLVTGVDVWLNNPIPSREASGTSGMKSALNGGLNLSAMDGWWIEGIERAPLSGWMFAKRLSEEDWSNRDEQDSCELLDNLRDVIDCYYNRPDEWLLRMKHAISLLAFFNTHRLVREYNERMWQ